MIQKDHVGAKEMGEGASVAIFPALANSIYEVYRRENQRTAYNR